MPRVSVLMVSNQGGPLLERAVRSVLEQTYRDLELVVVDDASAGHVVAREAEALMEGRGKVVRLDTHSGPYGAACSGLAACSGEFIVRHDADDESVPERVEALVSSLAADSAIAAMGSAALLVDEDGRVLQRLTTSCNPQEIADVARTRMPLIHPTMIIRRRALEAIPYRPDFFTAGDADLVARLCERFAVAALPVALYRYRQHPGSITSTKALLQEACGKAVVLMSARRRAGREEDLVGSLAEAKRVAASLRTRSEVKAHYARRLRQEGFIAEAAGVARSATMEPNAAPAAWRELALSVAGGLRHSAEVRRQALRGFAGAPMQAVVGKWRGSA